MKRNEPNSRGYARVVAACAALALALTGCDAPADDSASPCEESCEAGELSCDGLVARTCTVTAEGCADYTTEDCGANGLVCSLGLCVAAGEEPDAQDPDAQEPDAQEPDGDAGETTPDDVVGPDADEPDVPQGDVPPGDVAPEDVTEPINPADMVALDCETDDQCVVNCAAQGVCGADGRCSFGLIEGCLIKVADASGDVAICRDAGDLEAGTACMFCNPSWDQEAWTGTFAREDFESGLGHFSQVLALGDKEATWTTSAVRAAHGGSSLYFGDPDTMSYDTGGQAHAEVFTKPIAVPEGVGFTVHFNLWLETEELPGYDVVRVLIKEDGEAPTTVWTSDEVNGSTHGVFVPVEIVLSELTGTMVQVGFSFDTKDGLDNAYEGAYIDDVNIISSCCAADADCDDANPCTTDHCPAYGSACEHTLAADCCVSDVDCDDAHPCTVDVCQESGGACEHTAIEACCTSDEDCVSEDACIESHCAEPGGQCVLTSVCCSSDSDCDDEDTCTEDLCDAGTCTHDFTCCTSDSACNDGEYCTIDTCLAGECVHSPAVLPGCCSPEIESQNFEGGGLPYGWVGGVESGVGWHVADVGNAQSGDQVLYYGNPANQNYDDGTSNLGTITTSAIYIPSGLEATLSFKAYLDVESANWTDKLTVKIIAESNTFNVATKSNLTIKGWKTFTTDVSYLAGQNIQVSFTFETTSTNNNSGLGVLVDDLVVGTTCEAKPCSSNGTCSSLDTCLTGVCAASACTYVNSCCYADDECDDAQVCTVDSCSNGKCNFLPEPGCCEDLDDCSDGNPCTTDMCSGFGGSCSWEDVPGCCLSHADCNDGNECTQDKCSDDVCLNIDVCCESDDECDDGDDVCTVDACVSQFCSFEPTGADGCCESNPLTWDFESPINLDISSSTACTWAVVDSAQNQTQGGGKLLRYSKPGSNNYDCSLNSGTAVTEPFELQEGVAYTLSIKLMMDTETSTSYDKLFIYAVTNDKEIELWNKASLSAGKAQWGTYEFNFNAFAGEEVKLKFYFNSVDSVLNGTSGVFVDDITVTSTCLPAPCDSASDCSDGLNATTESCAGVGCDYTIP